VTTNVYYGDGATKLTVSAGYSVPGFIAGAYIGGVKAFTIAGTTPFPNMAFNGCAYVYKTSAGVGTFVLMIIQSIAVAGGNTIISLKNPPNGNDPILVGDSCTVELCAFDWNTVGNWFLSTATETCVCCSTSVTLGTPAGAIPNPATNVAIINASGYVYSPGYNPSLIGGSVNIINGPTGTYSGPINFAGSYYNQTNKANVLAAGYYTGSITLSNSASANIAGGTYDGTISGISGISISGGTFNGAITIADAQGGTFNGVVSTGKVEGGLFTSTSTVTFQNNGAGCSGGTFNGPVTMQAPTVGTLPGSFNISGGIFNNTVTRQRNAHAGTYFGYPAGTITGGTYNAPAVSVPYSAFPNIGAYLPIDPGFAEGGGTYAPTINITGVPAGGGDILGAGLP
jgi:hypothetical protein